MIYTNLGKKIREERMKIGLTQEELGERIDSTGAYIGQIERGERNASMSTIMLIAEKLNVSIDYLTGNMFAKNSELDDKILEELRNATNNQKQMIKDIIKIIKKYS